MADENKNLRFRILASIVGGEAINRFNSDINKTAKSANSITDKLGSLKTGFSALAGAWVTTEAVAYGRQLIDMADNLDELAEKSGIAVDTLAKLQGGAAIEGVAIEQLADAVKRLSVSMIEGATGNKLYKAAFDAMDVAIKDGSGNIRDASDVINEISDRFSKMRDGAAKTAIAVKIFGNSGAQLIPFLNKGSEEIKRFSVAIDADFAARAGQFNDTLAEMTIGVKNFALSGIRDILPTLQEIANQLNNTSGNSSLLATGFRDIGEVFRLTAIAGNSLIASLYTITDVVGTPLVMAASTLKDIWDGLATTFYDVGRASVAAISGNMTGALDILGNLASKGKEELRQNFTEQNKLFDDFMDRLGRRGQAMNKFNDNLLKNSILFGKGAAGALKDTTPDTSNMRKTAADIRTLALARTVERDRVQEFIDQQTLENQQRVEALGDIQYSTIELRKLTETRKIEAEAVKQGKTLTEEQRAKLMEATEAIVAHREQIVQQEYDMKRTYVYGAKEYLRDYLDNVTNNAAQIKQVFQTAFSSLEDTMVNFVKTGKANFRDFADAVIDELIRISIRQAVIAPIVGALSGAFAGAAGAGTTSALGSSTYSSAASSGAFTFAKGGIMSSSGPIPLNTYANGGVANSPQLAVFGEGKKAEAYVPLPDGRTIPVTMKGGSGGVNVGVTVNINKNGGEGSVESDQKAGKDLGNMIVAIVKSEMLKQMRPGGLLA